MEVIDRRSASPYLHITVPMALYLATDILDAVAPIIRAAAGEGIVTGDQSGQRPLPTRGARGGPSPWLTAGPAGWSLSNSTIAERDRRYWRTAEALAKAPDDYIIRRAGREGDRRALRQSVTVPRTPGDSTDTAPPAADGGDWDLIAPAIANKHRLAVTDGPTRAVREVAAALAIAPADR